MIAYNFFIKQFILLLWDCPSDAIVVAAVVGDTYGVFFSNFFVEVS